MLKFEFCDKLRLSKLILKLMASSSVETLVRFSLCNTINHVGWIIRVGDESASKL